MSKPKIYVEFDGPINQLGLLSGPVRKGFFEWIERVRFSADVVIVTPRARTDVGVTAVGLYLHCERNAWLGRGGERHPTEPLTMSLEDKTPPGALVLTTEDLLDGWDDSSLTLASLRERVSNLN